MRAKFSSLFALTLAFWHAVECRVRCPRLFARRRRSAAAIVETFSHAVQRSSKGERRPKGEREARKATRARKASGARKAGGARKTGGARRASGARSRTSHSRDRVSKIEKRNQINNKNYWKYKRRLCMATLKFAKHNSSRGIKDKFGILIMNCALRISVLPCTISFYISNSFYY